MRFRWSIVPILMIACFFAVLRVTNSNKDLMPFLGRWLGGFVVERVTAGPGTARDQQRQSLHGYLQIYLSNRRFLMHLEGEQETLDFDGSWRKLRAGRIELHTKNLKIDDGGGAQHRNPNLEFIPGDALRQGYFHDLIFDLSPDGKSLTGLLMSVGPLEGTHRFTR